MMRYVKYLVLLLALTACETNSTSEYRYPLNLSETVWYRLTPHERSQAFHRDQEVKALEENYRNRFSQNVPPGIMKVGSQQASPLPEQIDPKSRGFAAIPKKEIVPENLVECIVEGGRVDFHPVWGEYQRTGFTLVPDEKKLIEVFSPDRRKVTGFWAMRSSGGQEIKLCQRRALSGEFTHCGSVNFTDQDYKQGATKGFMHPGIGGEPTLSCGRGLAWKGPLPQNFQ